MNSRSGQRNLTFGENSRNLRIFGRFFSLNCSSQFFCFTLRLKMRFGYLEKLFLRTAHTCRQYTSIWMVNTFFQPLLAKMAKQFGQNGWQMAKLTIFGHLQSILDRFGDLCGHFQPTIAEQKQWDGNQAKDVRNTATVTPRFI